MRFTERFRPARLADVVGQPPVRWMQTLARDPYSVCILLEGPPGCGKTSTAMALAGELGCTDGWSGLHETCCSELSVEAAREMLRILSYRPTSKSGMTIWIMEEMEWLSKQCQVFLKDALEKRLGGHCIVVATSNGAEKISKPLRQRFQTFRYSASPCFMEEAEGRLREIWETVGGDSPFPAEVLLRADADGEFSMRVALDVMERIVAMKRPIGV